MMSQRTSILDNGLIWCGAGISIAEIQTGTFLAPLGLIHGLGAILLGHLIGCLALFLSGVIGGQQQLSAMNSVKGIFGHRGGNFFALLNVIQLIGWTGIMIYDASIAAQAIIHWPHSMWAMIIGGLIIVWLLVGIRRLHWVNLVTITLLLLLTVVMSVLAFHGIPRPIQHSILTFGQGVELAVAMPLSWLPLISDYTCQAERPVTTSAISTIAYGIMSCWMAMIGLGAALFTGQTNIALIMVKAGLGLAGLVVIIFSTITTTFMDAYSAGVSGNAIDHRCAATKLAVVATVLGTIGASCWPVDHFSTFLYWIGSVFAPMIAIQIVDYFILHRLSYDKSFAWDRLFIWLLGFVAYRCLMNFSSPVGTTLPAMLIVMTLAWLVGVIKKS